MLPDELQPVNPFPPVYWNFGGHCLMSGRQEMSPAELSLPRIVHLLCCFGLSVLAPPSRDILRHGPTRPRASATMGAMSCLVLDSARS
ncbi:hypothetical protein TNCV_100891 [Trichonephila clavipes]|nr:hypothetical protein TNCV_100891 [Trichonephila clavipes]